MKRPNLLIAAAATAAFLAGLAFVTPAAVATTATVPGAPTGLVAVPGDTTITLSWAAPSDNGGSAVLGYNLYQGTSSGGESGTPVNGSTLIVPETATVTGLTNAKTYFFVVKAVNAIGASAASNETWAIPAATAPGAPRDVLAAAGDASANVTWSAPSDQGGSNITRYTVLATDATTASKGGQSCVWTTGPLACLLTGLNNGDSYHFTVTATNSLGTGSPSNPSPSVVPAVTVPTPVASVVATPGNTTITLSWVAPADGGSAILGYNLYQATTSGGENYSSPVNGSTLISATTTTVTGLVNDKEYYFTLKALNAVGASAASSQVWAIPAGIVPSAPRSLSATRGYGSATVTWTAPSNSGGSAVMLYKLTAADATAATRGGQTCTWTTGPLSCIFTGLTDGDSYSFTAVAVNSVGDSVASSASNSVVPSPTSPAAPTGLTAVPSQGAITLSWAVPVANGASIVGYNVYEGTSSGGESGTPVNGSVLIATNSVTVSSLTNGRTYYFTAKAVNAIGSSSASNEAWAIPAPTVPGAPVNVTATPYGLDAAVVSWAAPATSGGAIITAYSVTPYIGSVAQGSRTFPAAPTSELVTGLKPGTTYSFAVAAVNSRGPGAPSLSGLTSLQRAPTLTSLTLSSAKLTYGHEQVEVFTVTVTPRYTTAAATGSVAIRKSTTTLCTVKLSSGKGSCSVAKAELHAGRYSLFAVYARNTNFVGSTSQKATLVVSKAATATGLVLSENTVTYGHEQHERLSVTVTAQYRGIPVTGAVTVNGLPCVIRLSSGTGSCTSSAKTFRVGRHVLAATYWGSASLEASFSPKKNLTVLK